jgi:hypothetical protein
MVVHVRTRTHVKVVDWAPTSRWTDAHECAMLLQGGADEVGMLLSKSGGHEEVDKELAVICGVTRDVAELALSIVSNKVYVIVLGPVVHVSIQSKVVDPIPFGATGDITV